MNKYGIIALIYLGTVCYVIAAYYHLSISDSNWSPWYAFSIAVPIVMIEYLFSLRGNRYANKELGLNPIQILIITMVFYFINIWFLNYFIIKNNIILWREVLSFILIISAFLLSTNMLHGI